MEFVFHEIRRKTQNHYLLIKFSWQNYILFKYLCKYKRLVTCQIHNVITCEKMYLFKKSACRTITNIFTRLPVQGAFLNYQTITTKNFPDLSILFRGFWKIKFLKFWPSFNCPWVHVRSHKKFGLVRLSRSHVYGLYKQAPRQAKYIF